MAANQYALENANVAMTSQPSPPLGAPGTELGSAQDLEQRSLESFLNPSHFEGDQFQEPQNPNDPLEQAKKEDCLAASADLAGRESATRFADQEHPN